MAEKLGPKDLVSIEALAISSMWEIAALVEVLERKGMLTKKEVLDMIQELRRRNPAADPSQNAIPEPYLNVQVENALIDRIIDLLNATGLTAHQAKELLRRVDRLIDLGDGSLRRPRTDSPTMPTIGWTVSLEGKSHTVELDHGWLLGRRIVRLDGKVVEHKIEILWINKQVEIDINDLEEATLKWNPEPLRIPFIFLSFTRLGAKKWADFTTRNVKRRAAILLDGIPLMAAVIGAPMTDGAAQIMGDFSVQEVQGIVNRLNELVAKNRSM